MRFPTKLTELFLCLCCGRNLLCRYVVEDKGSGLGSVCFAVCCREEKRKRDLCSRKFGIGRQGRKRRGLCSETKPRGGVCVNSYFLITNDGKLIIKLWPSPAKGNGGRGVHQKRHHHQQ